MSKKKKKRLSRAAYHGSTAKEGIRTSERYARRRAKRERAENEERLAYSLTAAASSILLVIAIVSASAVTVSAMMTPPRNGPLPTETARMCTVSAECTSMMGQEETSEPKSEEKTDETNERSPVTLSDDSEAPVILGLGDITVYPGETPAYLAGVSVTDNTDAHPSLSYDSSNVDIYSAGTYTVSYTAADVSGNVARAERIVTVSHVPDSIPSGMADAVLAVIVNDGMTEREKAWAIYEWAGENIRYSSGTMFLIDNFSDAAYYGMKYRAGNCYVYYSVASLMLTKCGIENIQIKRNSVTDPHYWLLVKSGDDWYHYDTCPHFKDHPITSFYLTDAEVRAYSENEVKDYYNFDASLYPPAP